VKRAGVVAQIFNLLHRRFSTCAASVAIGRAADCKSAIRQIANLRYAPLVCPLLLFTLSGVVFAQPAATSSASVRFQAIDIYVDSKDKPLAAYQLEFTATAGDVKIVGIEGGDHAAFAEAPFYDPQAMQHERVIIAAFSTADKLPTGKTRVATIHVQVTGKADPRFELKLQTAADARGNVLQTETSFAERKPQ